VALYHLLIINIDGASRGNPGLSGIGIIITKENWKIIEHKEFIGSKTNNQAEYIALKKAMQIAFGLDDKITILSDSQLLVNQRTNRYKVRNKQLKTIFREISNLEKKFQTVLYNHVPRSRNRNADLLANQAIDEHIKYENASI
jgi:ribonuclease HI